MGRSPSWARRTGKAHRGRLVDHDHHGGQRWDRSPIVTVLDEHGDSPRTLPGSNPKRGAPNFCSLLPNLCRIRHLVHLDERFPRRECRTGGAVSPLMVLLGLRSDLTKAAHGAGGHTGAFSGGAPCQNVSPAASCSSVGAGDQVGDPMQAECYLLRSIN